MSLPGGVHKDVKHASMMPGVILSANMFGFDPVAFYWSVGLVAVYYVAGACFYCLYCGWSFTAVIYFLTVTFTTVGYGDITPGDWVSRGVTCVFMVYGCIAIASCFAVLVGSIVKAQDDAIKTATRALVESLPQEYDDGGGGPEDGGERKARKHLSIKQVQDMELKEVYSKLFWLALELLVLIFIGAAVMVPWENWSVNIGVFWAVQTLFGVGYGDFTPSKVGQRWFTTIYIAIGCLFVVNIVGYTAYVPLLFRRRHVDSLILSQFDDDQIAETLKRILRDNRDAKPADAGPVRPELRREMSSVDDSQLVELHMSNMAAIEEIAQSRTEIKRPEFVLWLLMLLDRVDEHDVATCHSVFDRLDADKSGKLTQSDIPMLEARAKSYGSRG